MRMTFFFFTERLLFINNFKNKLTTGLTLNDTVIPDSSLHCVPLRMTIFYGFLGVGRREKAAPPPSLFSLPSLSIQRYVILSETKNLVKF